LIYREGGIHTPPKLGYDTMEDSVRFASHCNKALENTRSQMSWEENYTRKNLGHMIICLATK
jgi:hypothetical protein